MGISGCVLAPSEVNLKNLEVDVEVKIEFLNVFSAMQVKLYITSILLHRCVMSTHFPSSQVNSDSWQALMRRTCVLVSPWLQALFSIFHVCLPTGSRYKVPFLEHWVLGAGAKK